MIPPGVAIALACIAASPALGADLDSLWDFRDPVASEERFRAALETAAGDDAIILQTQIARTYVFRRQFSEARLVLEAIAPEAEQAGPEARIRYWLELGRTYASHQHSPESQSDATREHARRYYQKARDIAALANLVGLEIDAVHMFPFVDTAPADQLKWGMEALALIEASDQAEAKRWEASIRNNIGEALYDLGRHEEALDHFQRALVLRQQQSGRLALLNAEWHIARVLRRLNRTDEALEFQLRLERESDDADDPRVYVFEELELLYRAKGDQERAEHYAGKAHP